MVSRTVARPSLVLAIPAAAEVAVVAAVGASRHEGALRILVALVLAPIAVGATAAIAWRMGGRRFALLAAVVYVVLPQLVRMSLLGPFLAVYDQKVVPALLGLQHTGWFALGVFVAVMLALAPERAAAGAGIAAALVALAVWADGAWLGLWGSFHETTWSQTLLAFLPFAALVGAGRKSPWLAAGLGGWLAVLVLRGLHRDYGAGGFWLSLTAAAPAIAVLLSSLVYLVPRLRAAPAPDPAR